MRDAFIAELTKLAAADTDRVLITGDLGFGVLTKFWETYPDQFINAGVAEQNMTAIACGMALEGFKCYTYSIANFTTLRCLEHIRNDVCYHDADVTVVSVGGGFSYGQLGVSHFATEDIAILRAIPNMKVIAPTDPWEAAELTAQMAAVPGPKYLRLDKGKAGLPEKRDDVVFGKGRTIADGRDITLLATGAILSEALEASERLRETGYSVRVVALHTLKPVDEDIIVTAARETGGLVTVEEHTICGGLGSIVAEVCMKHGVMPGFLKFVGLDDVFPTVVGDQDYLRAAYGLNADAVVAAALKALGHEGRTPSKQVGGAP
ncbi:MAG: transketolase [Roseitalea sp.]|jgi:transketolase|nr:transketolase [Roseitalea sp.]MBO6722776.1 transketolase [Roseitalea sp.]MBO6745150.1 transketolase [Roseitalea sp.]